MTLATENSGAQGFPGSTRALECRLCGLPLRRPKAGPRPRLCRRCRELPRSLRRALSLARSTGAHAVTISVLEALSHLEERVR